MSKALGKKKDKGHMENHGEELLFDEDRIAITKMVKKIGDRKQRGFIFVVEVNEEMNNELSVKGTIFGHDMSIPEAIRVLAGSGNVGPLEAAAAILKDK